jgi:hypothetical protein
MTVREFLREEIQSGQLVKIQYRTPQGGYSIWGVVFNYWYSQAPNSQDDPDHNAYLELLTELMNIETIPIVNIVSFGRVPSHLDNAKIQMIYKVMRVIGKRIREARKLDGELYELQQQLNKVSAQCNMVNDDVKNMMAVTRLQGFESLLKAYNISY